MHFAVMFTFENESWKAQTKMRDQILTGYGHLIDDALLDLMNVIVITAYRDQVEGGSA